VRKTDLEKQLAKQAGLSPAEARDEVDELVRKVLGTLRSGRAAELPGLGRLGVKPADRKSSQAGKR
jgi:nucleoid DNA-binding protein